MGILNIKFPVLLQGMDIEWNFQEKNVVAVGSVKSTTISIVTASVW